MSGDTAPAVAIVGMGCMFPGSPDRRAFWVNVREGVDAITEVPDTHWDPRDYFDADPAAPDMTYARRGGFLAPSRFFPLEFGIPPRDLEATDTTQLLGLVGARMALEDAGYGEGGRDFDRDRTSVVLGVTGALELVIELGARLGHPKWRRALHDAGIDGPLADEVVARISASYVPWQENSFPGLLGNVAAGRIANRLDLRGTNCVVDAACASSLAALHLAMLELETGRADMVLTGGIDTFNDIFMYMCFSKTPALSPSGDARPFDADADGTILGEGVGLVVLKRLADAERDGDRIYAVIKGVGTASDGRGTAIYAPSSQGQARAIRAAHRAAGVAPRTIELVEAHGTGTRIGDAVEVAGLDEVFRSGAPVAGAPWCALGSVKSMIGHGKAAAGAAGLIKAALALHHRVLPPTIKVARPLAAVDGTPFHLTTTKRPWLARPGHPRRAGVSAFGFGGSNIHVVLEEHRGTEAVSSEGRRVHICALSGSSSRELSAALDELERRVAADGLPLTAARSCAQFDAGARSRLVIVHSPGADSFAELVERARRTLGREGGRAPAGIFLGEGPPGPLALLFPGQGSQAPNMHLDLACAFPCMRATLELFADAFRTETGGELGDLIYPPTAFGLDTRRSQEAALRATEVAQIALGAVSFGAWQVLRSFGVAPAMTAGHSYGELVALAAAERLEPAELARLSLARGRQMAASGSGGMLAVLGSIERVEAMLAEHRMELVVANYNAPEQAVVSGSLPEIERATEAFTAAGIRTLPLEVSAAFHSPLVADAQEPFAAAMATTEFVRGCAEVFANTSAAAYPEDAAACREMLAAQLARPVRFVEMIEAMYRAGARTFLELGPGDRLGGLVSRILTHDRVGESARDLRIVGLDAGPPGRSGEHALAEVLANLAASGHPVDLRRWSADASAVDGQRSPGERGFSVELSGANYRAAVKASAVDSPVPPAPSANDQARPVLGEANDIMEESTRVRAMLAVQHQLDGLLRIQEQTSELHRQFLEGQAAASASAFALLRAQQALLAGGHVERAPPPPVPAPRDPREQVASVEVPIGDRPPTSPAHGQVAKPAARREATASEGSRVPEGRRAIVQALFEVVADKTGYPPEMLDLSMRLDADLGIDSIKRVEILSALHERLPKAPRVGPDQLGELPTLGALADFLAGPAREERRGLEPPRRQTSEAASVANTPAAAAGSVQEVLLEIVADKTGYPAEMLELSMGLDSDLGIDSIKRVEILSALRERLPDAPIVEPAHLGGLHTLRDIVAFLVAGSGVSTTDPTSRRRSPTPATPGSTTVATGVPGVVEVLLAVVAEKTGYPAEMLDLAMGLDADLGIDSIKRVEILAALQERIPGAPQITPDRFGDLQTLAHIAEFLRSSSSGRVGEGHDRGREISEVSTRHDAVERANEAPEGVDRYRVRVVPLAPPEPVLAVAHAPIWVTRSDDALSTAIVEELRARGVDAEEIELPINGRTPPDSLGGLVIVAPRVDDSGEEDAAVDAFLAVRGLAPRLLRAGEGAVLATVSRLDGAFGFGSLPAGCPSLASGGLAGLVKTAALEWPELRCRAFDVDAAASDPSQARDLARRMVDEIHARGPIEIGLSVAGNCGLEVVPAGAPMVDEGASPFELADDEVILVSGGARGVTAEAAVAIAGAGGRSLVLLGRTPIPEDEPEWLAGLEDPVAIKRGILARAGESLTPSALEQRFAAITGERELRRTLARLARAGADVEYRAVDVRDAGEVVALVDELTARGKRIVALVHGAGVLADRRIEDKREEDFRRVLATKVGGLRHLLAAIPATSLRTIVLFSSMTARYGRRGQADYAVANELLNKTAQGLARSRPTCRVLSIGWGPWSGGMVTPSLRRLFETEGLAAVEVEDGARQVLVESRVGGAAVDVEILLLGRGSRLPVDLELAARKGTIADAPSEARPPELPTIFERRLDLESHPVLADHVIDGHPVLPTVLMIEWLAHGALHGNPGLHFHGIDELKIYKGAILGDGAALVVRVCAGRAERDGEHYRVAAQLVSGGGNGHRIIHAVGVVVLAQGPANERAQRSSPARPEVGQLRAFPIPAADIYELHLFHGPSMRGLGAIEGASAAAIIGTALVQPWPRPADWMRAPHRARWISMPLAIDLGLQLMVMWSVCEQGVGSLPTRFAEYRQFVAEPPVDGVEIVARVLARSEHRVVADLEWRSKSDGRVLASMRGYECVGDVSLNAAFRRNRVVEEASACT